ncbi:lipopolysaccharide biosynthesis protein [Caballeronia sp. LjRoot31]|uniref:lipopolysaccharide biosynthesis protein n=1 Tax=Caballeronia sp. LjRoot31 TaxID=3342324 RepID=UPI003ECCB2AF
MTDKTNVLLPDHELAKRDHDKIGDRVVSGVAVLWSVNLLLRLFQLVSTAILARLLTPADYGVVALATTIVGFIDIISNLQVGGALIRSENISRDHLDTAFTLNVIRGVIVGVILIASARMLASLMHDARLEAVLYALAVSSVIGSVHNPYFLLFARNLDFTRDAKRRAFATICGSVIGIAAALLVRSYWALVIGSIATNLLTMIFSYWKIKVRIRFCLTHYRDLVSYGSWMILIGTLDYMNSKVDYFLIGRDAGSKTLGAYHVGQQVTTMATGDVVGPLSSALLPAFSIMSTSAERLRAGYRDIQSVTLAVALPIGFGVSALASDFIYALVGTQWDLAIPVITFLAPLVALQSLLGSIESLALSLNQGRLLFVRTLIFFFVRVSLMFVGFYMGGFLGIIYARMISGGFFLLYGLWLGANLVNGRMFDPLIASWRSMVSVAIMWLAIEVMKTPNHELQNLSTFQQIGLLAIKICVGASLYVAVHLLLWRVTGLPQGAESRLINQGKRILHLLRRKRALNT